MDKAASRPRSPPGKRSSRARSRSDRWQKQRGKTPSLAATRGHTTALGHLGCHKNKVMEPCFGRRARRAAHVSDLRRSILRSGGGGRTLSGDAEPRCSLQPSRAAEAALPDARSPCGELGQNLEARDARDDTACARVRPKGHDKPASARAGHRCIRPCLYQSEGQPLCAGAAKLGWEIQIPFWPHQAPVCVRRLPRRRETRREARIWGELPKPWELAKHPGAAWIRTCSCAN